MSGHSKWSTIKRKKAAADAKRGKVFTKVLREVQVAAKVGGGSIEGNPRLRSAVQAARALSVPGDNIDKAIKRGTGALEGVAYEEVTYEGYGPGGVAIFVRALTDNKHRTAGEVRHAFTRFGGNLGSANSVAFQFQEKGVVSIPKKGVKEEAVFECALNAGAEDIKDEGDRWEVISEASDFEAVKGALEQFGESESGFKLLPVSTVTVSGKDAGSLLKLLDALDDLDDVSSVVSNFEMDASEIESLSRISAA